MHNIAKLLVNYNVCLTCPSPLGLWVPGMRNTALYSQCLDGSGDTSTLHYSAQMN